MCFKPCAELHVNLFLGLSLIETRQQELPEQVRDARTADAFDLTVSVWMASTLMITILFFPYMMI